MSYILQPHNGLPITTWKEDMDDTQLLDLLPILRSLAKVDDVRKYLKLIVKDDKVDFKIANDIFKNKTECMDDSISLSNDSVDDQGTPNLYERKIKNHYSTPLKQPQLPMQKSISLLTLNAKKNDEFKESCSNVRKSIKDKVDLLNNNFSKSSNETKAYHPRKSLQKPSLPQKDTTKKSFNVSKDSRPHIGIHILRNDVKVCRASFDTKKFNQGNCTSPKIKVIDKSQTTVPNSQLNSEKSKMTMKIELLTKKYNLLMSKKNLNKNDKCELQTPSINIKNISGMALITANLSIDSKNDPIILDAKNSSQCTQVAIPIPNSIQRSGNLRPINSTKCLFFN